MRFSVLLPTRNRLDLLKCAVESVMRQDCNDWEIIVQDNCSASPNDVAEYVLSLRDKRIKCFRAIKPVPVTENWNRAIDRSSGDYVIMMGDDDILMPGYFIKMARLVEKYHDPDCIYHGAYQYAYPGVIPNRPKGYLINYSYGELFESGHAYWLHRDRAVEMVRHSMNFEVRFGYNMQFVLMSRRLINMLKSKGDVFQSPYPDYYTMNAIMLASRRMLVYPHPVVCIGISPKSFGNYYFNGRESEGTSFLGNDKRQDTLSSWLDAMERIEENYNKAFYGLRETVNYRRYKRLRSLTLVKTWAAKFNSRHLTGIVNVLLAMQGTYINHKATPLSGTYNNILDVFNQEGL